MKTKLVLLLFLCAFTLNAQQAINYKAIIKDSNGDVLANTQITMQFTIGTGPLVGNLDFIAYEETHTPTTDANGIVIVNIGEGTVFTGVYADVDWSIDNYLLETFINTGNGLNSMGRTPFKAVPYALYATKAGNVSGLEAINEGNGIGYRFIGRNPDRHGNIGFRAIDLSNSGLNGDFGATGFISLAAGNLTKASGNYSTAFGQETIASGESSFASGHLANATALYAIAMGYDAIAEGNQSFAAGGESSYAGGSYAIALGGGHALGHSSIAIGTGTKASGFLSTSIGYETTASGENSTAMGFATTANSYAATTLGIHSIDVTGTLNSWVATDPLFTIGNGNDYNNTSNAFHILKNGTITAPSFDISEITDAKALITKEYADANFNPTGLEAINEGNGIGHRIMDRNTDNHGNIGEYAVDVSYSDTNSITYGATGEYSFATGLGTTASGSRSTALGNSSVASGTLSTAMGFQTTASGNTSTAMGVETTASGFYSTALGVDTSASSYASTALGSYNEDFGGTSDSWVLTEPLFTIGNGDFSNRSNAFHILKNGTVTAPSFTTSLIDTAGDKALITKEYADANYNSTGLEAIDEGNGTGYRIVNRNTNNYGNIGLNAVDFSYSTNSGNYGATGVNSTAFGSLTTASAGYSTAIGSQTIASGQFTFAGGFQSQATQESSFAFGVSAIASGKYASAFGLNIKSEAVGNFAVGYNNIGGGNPIIPQPTDPIFEVGNGNDVNNRNNAVTVLKNGNVGIGTHAPDYPLHITTSISGLNSTPAHYLAGSVGVGANGSGWSYSIGTSAGIFSSIGFATGSDNRIKDIIGISDSNEDLHTLMDIEITDYTFKDYKAKGKRISKKVIAQQVKEVLPNAVNQSTEYIPNVYELATVKKLENNLIQLDLEKQPEVAVGDKLKLITKANLEVVAVVRNSTNKNIVVETSATNLGDRVFVYGKQVNDFHSVDYDAISMLNVSATQAQQKLIEQLQQEIKALQSKNKSLSKEVSSLQDVNDRLAKLEALLTTKTTNYEN